jgi:hypothetical protein
MDAFLPETALTLGLAKVFASPSLLKPESVRGIDWANLHPLEGQAEDL